MPVRERACAACAKPDRAVTDLDQAIKWAAHGIFFNQGQTCWQVLSIFFFRFWADWLHSAGSRVFVQESIYDDFSKKFNAHTQT